MCPECSEDVHMHHINHIELNETLMLYQAEIVCKHIENRRNQEIMFHSML